MPQRCWLYRAIASGKAASICEKTVGFGPEEVVLSELMAVFYAPVSCRHVRKSCSFDFKGNRIEKGASVKGYEILCLENPEA